MILLIASLALVVVFGQPQHHVAGLVQTLQCIHEQQNACKNALVTFTLALQHNNIIMAGMSIVHAWWLHSIPRKRPSSDVAGVQAILAATDHQLMCCMTYGGILHGQM